MNEIWFDNESIDPPVEPGIWALDGLPGVSSSQYDSYEYQKDFFHLNTDKTILTLKGNPQTNIQHICRYLTEHSDIRELNLSGRTRWGPGDFTHLITHLPGSITTLRLNFCRLGDNQVELKHLPSHIKKISLAWNNISSKTAEMLLSSPHIEKLDLYGNQIDDTALTLIQDNVTLKSLNLGCNRITEFGAQRLSENTVIEKLLLKRNRVGDAGATALAQNPSLRSLNLADNQLGDDAAQAFHQNNRLTALNISENKMISETGILNLLESNLHIPDLQWTHLDVLGNPNVSKATAIRKQRIALQSYIKQLQEKAEAADDFQKASLNTLIASLTARAPREIPDEELRQLVNALKATVEFLCFCEPPLDRRNNATCYDVSLISYSWFKPLIHTLCSVSIAQLCAKKQALKTENLQKANLTYLIQLIDRCSTREMSGQNAYWFSTLLNSTVRYLDGNLHLNLYSEAVKNSCRGLDASQPQASQVKAVIGILFLIIALACLTSIIALLLSLVITTGPLAVIIAPFVFLFKEITTLVAAITIGNIALAPVAGGLVIGTKILITGAGFVGGFFVKGELAKYTERQSITAEHTELRNCLEAIANSTRGINV